MKIAIIGVDANTLFYCKKLLENPENIVYNIGPETKYTHDRFIPIPVTGTTLAERKQNIIDILDSFIILGIELIIPILWSHQLMPFFQEKVRSLNIPVLMPTIENAYLEWSKVYGKLILNELNIPTTKYVVYSANELFDKFSTLHRPFVLKFDKDWRAGMQTIIVTDDNHIEIYEYLMKCGRTRNVKMFGEFVDQTFIVEEYIKGDREYSYHVVCNGNDIRYIGAARDYKKRYENDMGKNTTSMGCYSNVDIHDTVHEYARKIVKHRNYIGILYLGIMVVDDKPIVLEINTRFGDPEFHMLNLLDIDMGRLFYQAANSEEMMDIVFKDDTTVTIMIVNENETKYLPDFTNIPEYIKLIEYSFKDGLNLHIVASLTCTGSNASNKIYDYINSIDMGNCEYRTDIGILL